MKSSQDILKEVNEIFATKWQRRKAQKVPDIDDVRLGNDAAEIEATVLYADMADSTKLVDKYHDWFAAEVYKTYLVAACHVIRNQSGEITAFDGDRVMAVFTGSSKNSDAGRSALQINYIVQQINGALKTNYPNSTYELRQCVGIDTSSLFVAKTGIRNANDLVWVGRAANYAAKLSGISEQGYSVFITEDVFNRLADDVKVGSNPPQAMWEKRIWQSMGITIYRSNWWWKF